MRMDEDRGLRHMYAVLRQYDDGVINTVAARKGLEIAGLRLEIGDDGPTRRQEALLRYLDEDRVVYETVAYILSIPEGEFAQTIEEIGPSMHPEYTPVPHAVIDSYRRGLSDLDLRMEDRAAGYVDDIVGIVNGHCEYRRSSASRPSRGSGPGRMSRRAARRSPIWHSDLRDSKPSKTQSTGTPLEGRSPRETEPWMSRPVPPPPPATRRPSPPWTAPYGPAHVAQALVDEEDGSTIGQTYPDRSE